MLKTLFKITVKRTLRVYLTNIMKYIYTIFNT